MSIIHRVYSRIVSTDEQLERADRRAFLKGLMVTGAGLVIARPRIFLPPRERVQYYYAPVYRADGSFCWLRFGGPILAPAETVATVHYYEGDGNWRVIEEAVWAGAVQGWIRRANARGGAESGFAEVP